MMTIIKVEREVVGSRVVNKMTKKYVKTFEKK